MLSSNARVISPETRQLCDNAVGSTGRRLCVDPPGVDALTCGWLGKLSIRVPALLSNCSKQGDKSDHNHAIHSLDSMLFLVN